MQMKVPSCEATAELIEKKSKFISRIFSVTTVEEANEKLAEVRKKHWDASHNCYAYVLDGHNVMRFSDDGEPQGTAGMPILEVLKKQQLCCVLIVVTRYFGGTLLGAGGLVRAYGKAATLAIDASGISEMVPFYQLELDCAYHLLTPIRNSYTHFDVREVSVDYGVNVLIKVELPVEQYQAFCENIVELTAALVIPKIIEEKLIAKRI